MLRKFERKAFCRVKKNMVLRALSQHPDKVLAKSKLKSLAMGIYFSIPKQQLFSLLENYNFFYDKKYQQRWKTFFCQNNAGTDTKISQKYRNRVSWLLGPEEN